MKLYEIATDINIDDVKSQPFFNYFNELRLYTGKDVHYTEITKVDFRYRTSPMNTILPFHNLVNKFSVEKFDIPVRNLVFSHIDVNDVMMYGRPYLIVPIGANFKLYTNKKYSDMTLDLNLDGIDKLDLSAYRSTMMNLYDESIDLNLYSELVDILLSSPNVSFIPKHFNLIVKRVFDKYSNMKDEISKLYSFIEHHQDTMIELIKWSINDALEVIAEDYISGMEIIRDDEQLTSEIMVYAPDGMYLIPKDHFEKFRES